MAMPLAMVTILLIEDSRSDALLIHGVLKKQAASQFAVDTVETLAQARAWLTQHTPDLILTDLTLPDSQGLETLKQVSALAPQTPIIVLTGLDDESLAVEALNQGAQDYLIKGEFDNRLVVRAIHYAIQRQQAEEDLRRNQERYQSLFEGSRDATFITRPDGALLRLNQAGCRLFGYDLSDVRTLNLAELAPKPTEWTQLQQTLTRDGAVQDFPIQLRNARQTVSDCLVNATARRDPAGEVIEYQGFIRDVTVRKASEEMWRRYEFIVNTSKEFMTLISRDYVYEAINKAYYTAHNKKREDIVGKTVAEVWGEGRYLDAIKQTLDECLTGKAVKFQGWLGFSALGKRYMDVTYYPYYNAAGEVTHAVVVSRDGTDRKLAEEALQQAHARNQQLLQSIPSILIGVNAAQTITHWNEPAEQAFGISAKQAIGHPAQSCGIRWDWPVVLQGAEKARAGQTVSLDELAYTHPDGSEGFLNLTITRFDDAATDGESFLLLGEDVTDRKVLQIQLANAQKLESIGQLAAGIAHEINTPTQYVGDNIRFLEESFDDLSTVLTQYQKFTQAFKADEATPEMVDDLETALEDADFEFLVEEIPAAVKQSLQGIDHVSGIVRAMKEFSHPGVEEKTAIDINRSIESTITVARNEWKYVADLETDFDPSLPAVPVLAGEFNQAILNIIINAAHAIGEQVANEPNHKGLIAISTQRLDKWAEIKIQDTGGGIPERIRERIFDPFFTTKEVGKGTGQGLAISHTAITEKHGGTIAFETQMGQGTTFIIRLPLDNIARNGNAHAGE